MRFYYPYENAPDTPVFPGGFVRYPKIPITIIHESVELPVLALIDSGAMATIFSLDYARALNIDVEDGIPIPQTGASGDQSNLWFHEVTLSLNGWKYNCYVGFPNENSLPVDGLLGYSGFFDRFKVRLRATRGKGIGIKKIRGLW